MHMSALHGDGRCNELSAQHHDVLCRFDTVTETTNMTTQLKSAVYAAAFRNVKLTDTELNTVPLCSAGPNSSTGVAYKPHRHAPRLYASAQLSQYY